MRVYHYIHSHFYIYIYVQIYLHVSKIIRKPFFPVGAQEGMYTYIYTYVHTHLHERLGEEGGRRRTLPSAIGSSGADKQQRRLQLTPPFSTSPTEDA